MLKHYFKDYHRSIEIQTLLDTVTLLFIVFVWSQYDGGNILAEVPSKTYRSQAEDYGRRLLITSSVQLAILFILLVRKEDC